MEGDHAGTTRVVSFCSPFARARVLFLFLRTTDRRTDGRTDACTALHCTALRLSVLARSLPGVVCSPPSLSLCCCCAVGGARCGGGVGWCPLCCRWCPVVSHRPVVSRGDTFPRMLLTMIHLFLSLVHLFPHSSPLSPSPCMPLPPPSAYQCSFHWNLIANDHTYGNAPEIIRTQKLNPYRRA